MVVWQLVDAVIVNFTFDPLFSRPGQTVTFTDLSGNLEPNQPCLHEWDFGDGSPHVFSANATHIYNRAGNYSVMKWVTGSANQTRVPKTLTYPVGDPKLLTVCDGTYGNTTGILNVNLPASEKWYLNADGTLGGMQTTIRLFMRPELFYEISMSSTWG